MINSCRKDLKQPAYSSEVPGTGGTPRHRCFFWISTVV